MSTYDTLMQGIKKNEKPQQEEKKLEDNKVSPTQSSELNEPQFRSSANNQSIETGDLQNRSFAEPQKASPKSPTLKRKVTYQGIGIYEDQFFKLRRLQAEILDATHKKVSFAELLGEALDSYFKKTVRAKDASEAVM